MAKEFVGAEKRSKPRTMVSEISFKRFGGPTYVHQQQVVANIAQSVLVSGNPNRVTMILTNNSASDIYIGFTPDVGATNALILAANGGTFIMTIDDEGEAVTNPIYSVGQADTLACTLIETLLQAV